MVFPAEALSESGFPILPLDKKKTRVYNEFTEQIKAVMETVGFLERFSEPGKV